MGFINVGKENSQDILLHYEDHGEGDVLVMIHGYPFSKVAWEKMQTRFLREGYRIISYDRRGFGQSSKPSIGYDWNTLAQDLHHLLSSLNLEDVHLIGHSMGTGEMIRYMALYGSSRINSAVFISPLAPMVLKSSTNPLGVEREVFDEFKLAIERDRYEFISKFLTDFYNPDNGMISDEKFQADFNLASLSSPHAFYQCVDTWTYDFRKDLPKITVPSLVVHGEDDQIIPCEVTGKALAEILDCKFMMIPEGSHGITWTHAEEICDEMLEFYFQTKKSDLLYHGSLESSRLFNQL